MAKQTKKPETVETKPSYRLLELRAENFKILKAVRVPIDGAVVTINGRNAQGKSSVLDAVAAAIGGKDYFPPKPIRDGQEESEIYLDFGDLKLTRRIWEKKGGGISHTVVLEYADGSKAKAGQEVLDDLRGSPIADDPLNFSRLKPKEQFDLLKSLVKGFDFEAEAVRRKECYEERTQVGRERDRAKAAADSISIPPKTPDEPVDVTALVAEMAEVSDYNEEVRARQKRREDAATDAEAKRDAADQKRAAAKALVLEADALDADAKAIETKLAKAEALPELKSAQAIAEQIDEADAINAAVRSKQDKVAKLAEYREKDAEYESLTDQINEIDALKEQAIESAKLPIKGLTLGDGEILLDGIPFEQASTARKIAVSTSLLMALKPDLRVLLIREGSLLDADSRAALEAAAEKNDFVVLMECVGDGDGSGVVIEDGEIV